MTEHARTRVITVDAKEYIQVYHYVVEEGRKRFRVLKSFGRNTRLHAFQAKLFATTYNFLARLVDDPTVGQVEFAEALEGIGLAVVGTVLGAKIVDALRRRKRDALR